MGCTSSAPNMPPSKTNSAIDLKQIEETRKKSMEEENEVIHSDKENETNQIMVLPTCDNLGESTQLARNNKSFIDTSSMDLEKEFHANGYVKDGDNMTTSKESETSENTQTEDKLSKLEEVVDKVVELYVADTAPENTQNIDDTKAKENSDKSPDEVPIDETKNATETETNEQKIENAEDIASPSQSESSRATRWEALADIAAELPPSLAVDPITGQIYSLSK